MRLIEELQRRIAVEASPFRAQMFREDIGRLRRLEEITRSDPDLDACRKAARKLGWTTMDTRTNELVVPLDRLVDAVQRSQHTAEAGPCDRQIFDAWLELTRLRMERMVGCLSTRFTEPSDE